MFKYFALAASALFSTAEATLPEGWSQLRSEGAVITNAEGSTTIQAWFAQPMAFKPNANPFNFKVRDTNGVLKAAPTVSVGQTTNYQVYTFTLSNLKNDYTYEMNLFANAAYPCTRDGFGGCKVQGALGFYGIGGNDFSPKISFSFSNQPLTGVISLAEALPNQPKDVRRFTITWNREAFPSATLLNEEVTKDEGILARGRGDIELEVRDLAFGQKTWTFSVKGSNLNYITVVLTGDADKIADIGTPAAYDASGFPNMASTRSPTVYSIRFRQDCTQEIIYFDEVVNQCDPETTNFCRDNPGVTLQTGITRIVEDIITSAAADGGAPCPPVQTTQQSPCTCPIDEDICLNRCDPTEDHKGISTDGKCSCAPGCLEDPLGCCFDITRNCRASITLPVDEDGLYTTVASQVEEMKTFASGSMPSCASPNKDDFRYPKGTVQCQESGRDSKGNVLCYCDQWCTKEGNCCADYNSGCFEGLCQRKAVGNFCEAEWVPDKYEGCQCDKECIAIGDCCRDFTTMCQVEPLCAHPGNCNKMMGSSTGAWCMCDHACLEQEPRDCCADYEAKCEVQATCQYRKVVDGVEVNANQPSRSNTFAVFGYQMTSANRNPDYNDNYLTQPIDKFTEYPILKEHTPPFGCGSVRFTYNNAWCSCDDQCLYWGDCCSDYIARCKNRNW